MTFVPVCQPPEVGWEAEILGRDGKPVGLVQVCAVDRETAMRKAIEQYEGLVGAPGTPAREAWRRFVRDTKDGVKGRR